MVDSPCMAASADDQYLQHAPELARPGLGRAAPHVYVGAVRTEAHDSGVRSAAYAYAAVQPAEALETHTGMPAGGWITSQIARAHVQELRHQSDALLVGAGTILSDDPLLTDRSNRPRRRPLLRVILDSRLRLPLESRLVQDVAENRSDDVLVVCSVVDEQKKSQLEDLGIRVETLPA